MTTKEAQDHAIAAGATILGVPATPAQVSRIDAMLAGQSSTSADQPVDVPAPAAPVEPPVKEGFRRITYDVPINAPELPPLPDQVFTYIAHEAGALNRKAIALYALANDVDQRIKAINARDEITEADRLALAPLDSEFNALMSTVSNINGAVNALHRAKMALAPYVSEKARQY